MYFASSEERQFVHEGLLPAARRQPVANELRGWSWPEPPLRPLTSVLVDLADLLGEEDEDAPEPASPCATAALRAAVADGFVAAKWQIYAHGPECLPHLERLRLAPALRPADDFLDAVRDFEARRLVERVSSALAQEPGIGADGLALLALPANVNVRVSGRAVGLHDHLTVDAVLFPEMVVCSLRLGSPEPRDRLTNTAYALALESRCGVPIELGCTVGVSFACGQLIVTRDYHLIDDELRQVFIEERDDHARRAAAAVEEAMFARRFRPARSELDLALPALAS